MTELWQNVAVLGIVLGATAYVVWRVWRRGSRKEAPGCPACSECLQWWEEAPLVSKHPSQADRASGRCAEGPDQC